MPASCSNCMNLIINNECFHCSMVIKSASTVKHHAPAASGASQHIPGVVMGVRDVTGMDSIPVSMFKKLAGGPDRNNRIFRCRSHPTKIVGKQYSLILPCQPHINMTIVEKKKNLFTSNDIIPQVKVIYIKDLLYLCGDGHHTFVAAMEAGFHIQLRLMDFGLKHTSYKSWKDIQRAPFTMQPSAITGTPMLPFNSSHIIE